MEKENIGSFVIMNEGMIINVNKAIINRCHDYIFEYLYTVFYVMTRV